MPLNIVNNNLILEIPLENEILCKNIIRNSLEQHLYKKINFLSLCLKNNLILNNLFDIIKSTSYQETNFINLIISDPNYNIVFNQKFVDVFIKIFDNFNYEYCFVLLNTFINKYMIKSQHLETGILNDIYYQKKEKDLLNFTYFIIELFNKKFRNNYNNIYRNDIINIIIKTLDIGIINFYEELNFRIEDLKEIKIKLAQGNLNNVYFDIYISERRELLKREIYLKKILNYLPLINDFVDYLINNFYSIKNNDIYNLIYVYKKNNRFIYKNTKNFITFSKLIMNSRIFHDEYFIINYTNFYIDLAFEYSNCIYLDKISNKLFIEPLFEISYNISKSENFIYTYIFKICKFINYIYVKKPKLLKSINPVYFKKFIFTVLSHLNYFYYNFYSFSKESKFKYLIDFLFNLDKDLIISFELRNIYIENVFFLLEQTFNEEHKFLFDKYIAKKLNIIIKKMINYKYNSLLNYFAYDVNELDQKTWIKYISYFKHTNYLILNFTTTVKRQLEYNNIIKKGKDPICNNIIEVPVNLPNSDIVMDKYIISRCLMENEINPFNRTKLTLNELNMFNNTLNKII